MCSDKPSLPAFPTFRRQPTGLDRPEIGGVPFHWDTALKSWIGGEPPEAFPITVHLGVYAFRDSATGDLVSGSDFEAIAMASIRAFRLARQERRR